MILKYTRIRVVHGSDGPAGRVGSGRVGSGRVGSGRVGSGRVGSGRVGSGRVGSGHDFARFWRVGSGRVGSGQHFGIFSFLLIISQYLNRCVSSNTTFGLIDFLRYLI